MEIKKATYYDKDVTDIVKSKINNNPSGLLENYQVSRTLYSFQKLTPSKVLLPQSATFSKV
jgi:hypothetical protein